MSFGSPLLLLSLLLAPALLAWILVARSRPSRQAVSFTNLELLAELASTRRSWRRWVPVALFLLALTSAAAATARPKATFTTVSRHSTIVLLVDVSGSMSARDVEPTRLDAAAAAMRTFIDRLPKQVDVGLVQFSTEPEVIQRPTEDHELVRESLGYMVPEAGTAIGDALAKAASLIHGSGAIVLLSDGKQSTQRGLSPLQGAARARAAGAKVDTVALGTPDGALIENGYIQPVPPDPPTMRLISRATGGSSYRAREAGKLDDIYSGLGQTIARKRTTHEITSWFALGAGLLLLGAVGLARTWGSSLT